MGKSNLMTVTFRVPNGGGGIVQGISYAEINKALTDWIDNHGECFSVTNHGYYRTLYFSSKKNFRSFLRTFKPNREHWWQNAKIEGVDELKKEIKLMERRFKDYPPIQSALHHYVKLKQNLEELESGGNSI